MASSISAAVKLKLVLKNKKHHTEPGADLGGGADAPSLRDSTSCRPKGSPFGTF